MKKQLLSASVLALITLSITAQASWQKTTEYFAQPTAKQYVWNGVCGTGLGFMSGALCGGLHGGVKGLASIRQHAKGSNPSAAVLMTGAETAGRSFIGAIRGSGRGAVLGFVLGILATPWLTNKSEVRK